MPSGRNTKEYRRVKENYPDLSDAIAGVIDWVCPRFVAKGLITEGQKDEACIDRNPANARASKVTGLLLNKIEQDVRNFQMLIGVLQSDKTTFGVVLRQLGVDTVVDDGSFIGQDNTSSSTTTEGDTKIVKKQPVVATKDTETDHKLVADSFSDNFSPQQLCDWLAAVLGKKGLELGEERDLFIKEKINGSAFKTLTDKDLKEIGFSMGPRRNILPIISDLSVSVKVESQPPVEDYDAPKLQLPRTRGCTMNLSQKKRMTAAAGSGPSKGVPACMPCKDYLWRKEVLVVELCNERHLERWGIGRDEFLEYANRWSTGDVEGGNHIPKFVLKHPGDSPDIVVEFNEESMRETNHIGFRRGCTTRILLDLSDEDKVYCRHLIVHEFGHALGLEHEHQRSTFWRLIKDFINLDKMIEELGDRSPDFWDKEHVDDGGSTEYDPESVMHYWFAREWLIEGYSTVTDINSKEALTPEAKRALRGILQRHRNVVSRPSKTDLKFLSDQYKSIKDVAALDMPPEATRKRENESRGSEPPTKRSRVVEDSPSKRSHCDFSQLKEVSSILLDLIRWDGDKQELRIYSKTGASWRTIARKLGLEVRTPGCIENIARRHFYDDGECVRDVFGKWFENAVGLPNGSQFSKSWEGLFNLLTESDLGEVAKELHVALTAADSSAKRE